MEDEVFTEIRNKELSSKVRDMTPEKRREFFKTMKGQPVVLLIRVAEVKLNRRNQETYDIRSMISNGVGVHLFEVSKQQASELRNAQLVQVRGRIRELFYTLGVQIHIDNDATFAPLE